jgi:hypothetical protein
MYMEQTIHLHYRLHAPNNHFDRFLTPLLAQASFPGKTHEIARILPSLQRRCLTSVKKPQCCNYSILYFSTCKYPSDCRPAWRTSPYALVISPSLSRCASTNLAGTADAGGSRSGVSGIRISISSSCWMTPGVSAAVSLSCHSRSFEGLVPRSLRRRVLALSALPWASHLR